MLTVIVSLVPSVYLFSVEVPDRSDGPKEREVEEDLSQYEDPERVEEDLEDEVVGDPQ